jgi:hypothetical protein
LYGVLVLGQGVQGAEAGCEFDRRQAALAVEPAEKIPGGAFPFLRVAFRAAGNEIAVGIAARLDARHDMVKTANQGGEIRASDIFSRRKAAKEQGE